MLGVAVARLGVDLSVGVGVGLDFGMERWRVFGSIFHIPGKSQVIPCWQCKLENSSRYLVQVRNFQATAVILAAGRGFMQFASNSTRTIRF